jgi:hypothetical protein
MRLFWPLAAYRPAVQAYCGKEDSITHPKSAKPQTSTKRDTKACLLQLKSSGLRPLACAMPSPARR